MTNTNELTAKLKAAAQEALQPHERLSVLPLDDIFDISLAEGTQLDADITAVNAFHDEATPANILALTEALEAAEKDAKQWKEVVAAFCADDADWHKLTTSNNELISQLSIALCKQADRIAELEARTLTVKLPQRAAAGKYVDEEFNNSDLAAIYNACRLECEVKFKEACAAAGIKLQIEGE